MLMHNGETPRMALVITKVKRFCLYMGAGNRSSITYRAIAEYLTEFLIDVMAFFFTFLRKKLKIIYLRERFTGTERFSGTERFTGTILIFFRSRTGTAFPFPWIWHTGTFTGTIGPFPY